VAVELATSQEGLSSVSKYYSKRARDNKDVFFSSSTFSHAQAYTAVLT
jgi:hypothetical protein